MQFICFSIIFFISPLVHLFYFQRILLRIKMCSYCFSSSFRVCVVHSIRQWDIRVPKKRQQRQSGAHSRTEREREQKKWIKQIEKARVCMSNDRQYKCVKLYRFHCMNQKNEYKTMWKFEVSIERSNDQHDERECACWAWNLWKMKYSNVKMKLPTE